MQIKKNAEQKEESAEEAASVAANVRALDAEKKQCLAEKSTLSAELERLKNWGDIDLSSINDLKARGYEISLYEMPKS